MIWYRASDPWKRKAGARQGQTMLKPKAGTKWHLVDEAHTTTERVYAACSLYCSEPVAEAIFEYAVKVRPGLSVATPGRGAACALCLRRAARAE